MQWDKETEAMLNGWFHAPQNFWENWWDMVAGSMQNGHSATTNGKNTASHAGMGENPFFGFPMGYSMMGYDMMSNFWQENMKQWQQYMEQNLQALAPESADSAKFAMDQFLSGQMQAQQLFQLTAEAWQTIARNASSPEEWQKALAAYVEEMRSQMADATDVEQFMTNSTKLWQLYMQEMQKFMQPWLQTWQHMPQPFHSFASSDSKLHPFLQLMNSAWDSYGQTWGRMANMPSIGLTRELNEKLSRSFVVWQENQRIGIEYQTTLADVMVQAFEAFMQRLLTMAKEEQPIDSQNQLMELWVEVADEEFLTLFHSERYAAIQSKYVNSSMALRQQQRELVEVTLRMNDLPTQSDMDEAHKNIFQLRKEVKALKKTVHELTKQMATATAQTNETATVKAASKAPAKGKATTKRTTAKRRTKKSEEA